MARKFAEHTFDGNADKSSYDSEVTMLGDLIFQNEATPSWAGPAPVEICRVGEAPLTSNNIYRSLYAITYNEEIDLIFLADGSSNAATRRIALVEFNKTTHKSNFRGIITLTFAAVTSYNIRSLYVSLHTYTTGTVEVSGTAVTGSGTAWRTARFAVGSRIGFGSTNADDITQWHEISAIANDTGITLKSNAGTVSAGTAFIIEELRIFCITTNSTTTNGGLMLVKGVSIDTFGSNNVGIPVAVSTDNVRAVYWLKDAATVTSLVAVWGAGVYNSNTSHDIYLINLDVNTTPRFYKFNGRAALTVSSGASTDAFLFKTGTNTIPNATAHDSCAVLATTGHGPGQGEASIYFTGQRHLHRVPLRRIQDGVTNCIINTMVVVPPGNAYINASAANPHGYPVYDNLNDKFIITDNAIGLRGFYTKYRADGGQYDSEIFSQVNQSDASTSWPGNTPNASTTVIAYPCYHNGYFYHFRTTVGLYIFPLAVQWDELATADNRLITAKIATTNAVKFIRAYVNADTMIGDDVLGTVPEAFRVYARSSGIDDNSGTWTLLNETGDLSNVAAANYIQFMFEFRMVGLLLVPARLFSVNVIYEDDSTDHRLQFSSKSTAAPIWRLAHSFGGTLPTLRVRIKDAETGNLLLEDTTSGENYGTFEKSTDDGETWGSWNATDKANEITYFRYVPNNFPGGIRSKYSLFIN